MEDIKPDLQTKPPVKYKRYNLFECEICTKKCSNKQVLEEHMRSHNGDKPFECDICQKRFSTKCNQKMHRRTHFEAGVYIIHFDHFPTHL